MSKFGNKLDPHYSARTAYGVKGNRQGIVVTNNPSTIDANKIVTIRFPNLGENDVIIPGTARLVFNITPKWRHRRRSHHYYQPRSGAREKITVKLAGQEVMSLDDADIYICFRDLWITDKGRLNAAYYIDDGGNTAKIRLGANDAVAATQPDASITAASGNRFVIPLDFEILTDHGPFYQAGLNDRLSFQLWS